jgi:transposase
VPRPYLKLVVPPETKAQLEQRLATTVDPRERKRLQAVLLALRGGHGYRDIARMVGCATSTYALWLKHFQTGGIASLLRRQSPPGLTSPLSAPELQRQLKEGLEAGQWDTANHVAVWLQQTHGVKRSAKSLYRWIGRSTAAPPAPLPSVFQLTPQNPAFSPTTTEHRIG